MDNRNGRDVWGRTQSEWEEFARQEHAREVERERQLLAGRDPEAIYYSPYLPAPIVGAMATFYCRSSQCRPRGVKPRRVEATIITVTVKDTHPHGQDPRYRHEVHTAAGTCPHCGGPVTCGYEYGTNYAEYVICAPARQSMGLSPMDAAALGMDDDGD